MPSCEKCWVESHSNPEHYQRLIKINKCTPEEQAGEDAGLCPICERFTIHQYCHICMNPSCLTELSGDSLKEE